MRRGPQESLVTLAGLLVAACALVGCSATTGGQGGTDSSSAFAAFSRTAGPDDRVPSQLWDRPGSTGSDVHDDRKIAASNDLAIYLVHAEPDWLCLVTSDRPGLDTTGGEVCSPGTSALSEGLLISWTIGASLDVADARTAVLVPDGFTATVTRGTFVLAGQGVLVAGGDGVDVTLVDASGRILHLSSPPRTTR